MQARSSLVSSSASVSNALDNFSVWRTIAAFVSRCGEDLRFARVWGRRASYVPVCECVSGVASAAEPYAVKDLEIKVPICEHRGKPIIPV